MSSNIKRSNSSPSSELRYFYQSDRKPYDFDEERDQFFNYSDKPKHQKMQSQRSSSMSSSISNASSTKGKYSGRLSDLKKRSNSFNQKNKTKQYDCCPPTFVEQNHSGSILMRWIFQIFLSFQNYFNFFSWWSNYNFNYYFYQNLDNRFCSSSNPISQKFCDCQKFCGNRHQIYNCRCHCSNPNSITTGNLLKSTTLSSFVAPPSSVVDHHQQQNSCCQQQQKRPRSISLLERSQQQSHQHYYRSSNHGQYQCSCAMQNQQNSSILKPSILNILIKPLFNTFLEITHANTVLNFAKNMRQKIRNMFRWCPTSSQELEEAEQKVLSYLKCNYQAYHVDIGKNGDLDHCQIWTLEVDPDSLYLDKDSQSNLMMNRLETKPDILYHESPSPSMMSVNNIPDLGMPLVMIHGFAAGVALWTLNLDELAQRSNRKIFAFDLLGFARSSRPKFPVKNFRNLNESQRIKAEAEQVEEFYVESIEKWRKSIGEPLQNKFILMGHSFGAYLSLAYALRYPSNVAHLILADAWGVASEKQSRHVAMSSGHINTRQLPWWAKILGRMFLDIFNPLSALRALGPWGPSLVQTLRPDIRRKFERLANDGKPIETISAAIKADHPPPLECSDSDDDEDLTGDQLDQSSLNDSDINSKVNVLSKSHHKKDAQNEKCVVLDYIYHCNAQSRPSGEQAFKKLCTSTGWARLPMLERIHELDPDITLTFIYGSRSWIDRQTGLQAKYILATKSNTRRDHGSNRYLNNNNLSDESEECERVEIHVIDGAGHHVYADKPEEFNDLLISICTQIDFNYGLNVLPPFPPSSTSSPIPIADNNNDLNDAGDDDENNNNPDKKSNQEKQQNDSTDQSTSTILSTDTMINRPGRKYGNYDSPTKFDASKN